MRFVVVNIQTDPGQHYSAKRVMAVVVDKGSVLDCSCRIHYMAQLDYVFLADYAAVTGGKLTAIGASFTKVVVPSFPTQLSLYIAGRIRADHNEGNCPLTLTILPPDGSYEIRGDLELEPEAEEPYKENKVGLLFAAGVVISLPTEGLYAVQVSLGNEVARELKFFAEEEA